VVSKYLIGTAQVRIGQYRTIAAAPFENREADFSYSTFLYDEEEMKLRPGWDVV